MVVSFLVYPGTSGAPFVDYIVSDAVVTPPEHADLFTERFVLMPWSYQVRAMRPGTAVFPTLHSHRLNCFLCDMNYMQINHYTEQSVRRTDAFASGLFPDFRHARHGSLEDPSAAQGPPGPAHSSLLALLFAAALADFGQAEPRVSRFFVDVSHRFTAHACHANADDNTTQLLTVTLASSALPVYAPHAVGVCRQAPGRAARLLLS